MTRLGFRSLGAPLAITGTILLGLTPTMTSSFMARTRTVTAAVALRDNEALIMGGTGPCCVTAETPWGLPGPPYTTIADQLFIAPNHPGYTPVGLATPEQLAPFTGLDSEPFGVSLQQGTETLNTAIGNEVSAGNDVVAFGYSQSATIETLELEQLAALPADERPSTDQLAFVMIGDGNNPDGGLLERFDGAFIPSLDASFSGATPDDVYPTDIYTLQYDGWADYPQYPLNILADLNAFAGIAYVHGEYPYITAAQVGSATDLPTTAGDTLTNYYLIPTENLPLLEPLEQLGAPQWLIDLIQPDLTVIVNLGYGDGPADVPTLAQLFPTDVNPITVVDNLVQGTVTGVNNALTDVGLPDLPAQITGPITDLENSLTSLADQINPAVQAFSDGLQDALNSVIVPTQLADALAPVSDAFSSVDTSLSALVDDEIDPAIQSAVYDIGDPLREALTSLGTPDQLANGVYILEQVLPTLAEVPNDLLTNGVHFTATGLQDLVANNFDGFVQELELIPTGDITLSLFGGLLPLLGLEDLLTGASLSI
jgi:PE-PPE domain